MPGRCSQGVGLALSIIQEHLRAGVEPRIPAALSGRTLCGPTSAQWAGGLDWKACSVPGPKPGKDRAVREDEGLPPWRQGGVPLNGAGSPG